MSDPVTYTAVLPVAEETVQLVSGLLGSERRRRGTRGRRRAPGCYRQAVRVLRWFLDGTRLAQLAKGNAIGRSTAYRQGSCKVVRQAVDLLGSGVERLRSGADSGPSHRETDRQVALTWARVKCSPCR